MTANILLQIPLNHRAETTRTLAVKHLPSLHPASLVNWPCKSSRHSRYQQFRITAYSQSARASLKTNHLRPHPRRSTTKSITEDKSATPKTLAALQRSIEPADGEVLKRTAIAKLSCSAIDKTSSSRAQRKSSPPSPPHLPYTGNAQH